MGWDTVVLRFSVLQFLEYCFLKIGVNRPLLKNSTDTVLFPPELNPIEQSWPNVNSKVKRNKFLEKESLIARINIYLTIFSGTMGEGAYRGGK